MTSVCAPATKRSAQSLCVELSVLDTKIMLPARRWKALGPPSPTAKVASRYLSRDGGSMRRCGPHRNTGGNVGGGPVTVRVLIARPPWKDFHERQWERRPGGRGHDDAQAGADQRSTDHRAGGSDLPHGHDAMPCESLMFTAMKEARTKYASECKGRTPRSTRNSLLLRIKQRRCTQRWSAVR